MAEATATQNSSDTKSKIKRKASPEPKQSTGAENTAPVIQYPSLDTASIEELFNGISKARNGSRVSNPSDAARRKSDAVVGKSPHHNAEERAKNQLWSLGSDFSEQTFHRQSNLLSSLSHPSSDTQRIAVVTELQRTYGNRYVQRLAEHSQTNLPIMNRPRNDSALRRKELAKETGAMGEGDWTKSDRENNTERWQKANLYNLRNLRSDQYTEIAHRRDFYLWFYNHTARKGFHTRWALAAWIVAGGAAEIAETDFWEGVATYITKTINNEIQAMARIGNQVIFDDVFPKLRELEKSEALTGKAALDWDMKVLSNEQALVQSMYSNTPKATVKMFEEIAKKQWATWVVSQLTSKDEKTKGEFHKEGTVPAFKGDILSGDDRWNYGMALVEQFSGLPPYYEKRPGRPDPDSDYASGERYKKANVWPGIHRLDARLNDENVPEKEVISILKGLRSNEQSELYTNEWRVNRLGKALNFKEMKEAISGLQYMPLVEKLRFLERSLITGWRAVSYEEIKPIIVNSSQSDRNSLNNDRWMNVFVKICTNKTMKEALIDLNFDPETKKRWTSAEE